MRFYSPLRYPGGKNKLSKYIMYLIEVNDYYDGIYVEPFAGGAAVALSLLFNEYVSKTYINDLDISIYSFWYSVLNHTEELCKLIYDAPLTIEEWRRQKEVQNNAEKVSILELGFSTFFLNRTNVSGIIKGGVIGGLKQDGKWKMDARFKKQDLISRIEKIAMYKDRIKLYNLCAKDLISKHLIKMKQKCFVYFDPPYYCKGPELYKNHFNHKDHLEISKLVRKIKNHYWILTYDNVPEILNIYNGIKYIEYSLNYSAGNKTKGKEIMFFSDNLLIPKIENPLNVKLN